MSESILTDADRAKFNTPQKRLMSTMRAIELMTKEFGLTQADVEDCREETRRLTEMMIRTHTRHPGAGEVIDDVKAVCDVLDKVFAYMRCNE